MFAFIFAWMQTMHNIVMDIAKYLVIYNTHVSIYERKFVQYLGMFIQILLMMYLAIYFVFALSPENFFSVTYVDE
uniref:Cytochrome b n=1 Tax=Strongyloides papillosus TaxID=174720 RepID=A0A0N5CFZ9_STREA